MVCQGKDRKFLLCKSPVRTGPKGRIQRQIIHADPLKISDSVPQDSKYPFHLMIQSFIYSKAAGICAVPLKLTTPAYSPRLMILRRNLHPRCHSFGILLLDSLWNFSLKPHKISLGHMVLR